MGRKTSEATKLAIKIRGNMLWLRRSIKGEDCFYSSGYSNTPQHKAYLTKNGEALFWQKYNEAHNINDVAYYTLNFRDYGSYVLEVTDSKRTKQKTKENVLSKFQALCTYFGRMEVNDITPSKIEYWQTLWLSGKWSPGGKFKIPAAKTVINYRSVLSLVLRQAQKDGVISNNPIELADTPKVNKKIAHTYPMDEISKILSVCDERFANLIRFALWTGMRPSELIALKWSNVNLELGYILVNESMVEGEVGITKNGNERMISILPQLVTTIQKQAFATRKSEYVFLNQYNRPYVATKAIQAKFAKLCELSGVRVGEFYDLKRSFVTIMKQNRQPIDWLKQQVGHSAATTTDIYTGLIKPDINLLKSIKAV